MTDVIANLGAHRRKEPCEDCGIQQGRHDRTCPKAKRGRRARSRGNRRELYIQKRYGPTKVGHFGGAIDNVGRSFKWQSKTTQGDPPLWVARLDGIRAIKAKRWFTAPMDHMGGLRNDLAPLVIKSWTRPGGSTDVIVVGASDWFAMHGLSTGGIPGPLDSYVAMTGDYFLETHGRDEEEGATIVGHTPPYRSVGDERP